MNVLLVTLDQFRGDCLSVAGHPVVRTPHLDRLAREGVRLARHYSQAAPCGPGRASLYTGMYQMNHRVVANGTPLDRRFDNIAKCARRAGYKPTLFGYTDQAIDPRDAHGPDDPRLSTYEGILPGFDVGLAWGTGAPGAWLDWMRGLGHPAPDDIDAALAGEPERPAAHSLSAFHTEVFLAWLERWDGPWFAHLSQLRPHPPYAAAGVFTSLYDPAALPTPIAPAADRHRLHEGLLADTRMAAPREGAEMARLQAQYYGMISEADHQLGRIWDALEARGDWDQTFIVVTADHGEQLGDHGLIQKGGFFEQSYHVLGLVRDPRPDAARGVVVKSFTENVDIFPTICEAIGVDIPPQCDGASLAPFLEGRTPPAWRDAAHWEFDWRADLIRRGGAGLGSRLERRNLAVRRGEEVAYAHFGDGSWLCFDLAADPTWRTPVTDTAAVLREAQALLTWRARHAERTLTGMLAEAGGVGRWPEMPTGWEN